MERPNMGPILPAEDAMVRADAVLQEDMRAAAARATDLLARHEVIERAEGGMVVNPRFFAMWEEAARGAGSYYATLGDVLGAWTGRALGADAAAMMCAALTGMVRQAGSCRELCEEAEEWDRTRGATITHEGLRDMMRRARRRGGRAAVSGGRAEEDAAVVWERAVDLLVKYGILEHRKDGFARDREFAAMWAANVPRAPSWHAALGAAIRERTGGAEGRGTVAAMMQVYCRTFEGTEAGRMLDMEMEALSRADGTADDEYAELSRRKVRETRAEMEAGRL